MRKIGSIKNYFYKNKIFTGNLLSLIIFIFIIILIGSNKNSFNTSRTLIIELSFLVFPILFFFLIQGYFPRLNDFKDLSNLNRLGVEPLLYSLIIVLLAYPLVFLLNMFTYRQGIPNLFNMGESFIFNEVSTKKFFSMLVNICILPALCEEIYFRGMLYNLQKSRPIYGVSVNIILFIFFHFNTNNIIGPMAISIISLFLLLTYNSVIPGILSHFTYNLISLLLSFLLDGGLLDTIFYLSIADKILMIILFIILLICSVYFLFKLVNLIYTKEKNVLVFNGEVNKAKQLNIYEYYNLKKDGIYNKYQIIIDQIPLLIIFLIYIYQI